MDEVVQNLRAPGLRHDLAADLGIPRGELLRRREEGWCNETNILLFIIPDRFRRHLYTKQHTTLLIRLRLFTILRHELLV